jgi:Protein of unknown function (DUF3223)
MAKPVTIGTRTFDSQTAARKYIREVRDRHPLLAAIDDPDHTFLLNLLNKHSRAAEKIGAGVKHFTSRNRSAEHSVSTSLGLMVRI